MHLQLSENTSRITAAKFSDEILCCYGQIYNAFSEQLPTYLEHR